MELNLFFTYFYVCVFFVHINDSDYAYTLLYAQKSLLIVFLGLYTEPGIEMWFVSCNRSDFTSVVSIQPQLFHIIKYDMHMVKYLLFSYFQIKQKSIESIYFHIRHNYGKKKLLNGVMHIFALCIVLF